jgi:DNA-binding response OmpR family regulator
MAGPLRILLIEDDMTSHAALVRVLKQMDYHVHSATTLREGMSHLSSAPDCAILDLMLPDGNGVAALVEIRERKLPIKVAVTTGASDPEMLKAVAKLAPEKIFMKPVDIPELLGWLRGCESGTRG